MNHPFNPQTTQSIQNNEATVAIDALVLGNLIEDYWVITIKNKTFKVKHKLYSKDQRPNTPRTIEAIVLLDLVEIVTKRTEQLTKGKIVNYNNNKKICKMIHGEDNIPN